MRGMCGSREAYGVLLDDDTSVPLLCQSELYEKVVHVPKRFKSLRPIFIDPLSSALRPRSISLEFESPDTSLGQAACEFIMQLRHPFHMCLFTLQFKIPRQIRRPIASVRFEISEHKWSVRPFDVHDYNDPSVSYLEAATQDVLFQQLGQRWFITALSNVKIHYKVTQQDLFE